MKIKNGHRFLFMVKKKLVTGIGNTRALISNDPEF